MTKRELSKYYYLKLEIKNLEEKIQEVNEGIIGSRELTGMPHGTGKSNPVEKKVIILTKLKNRLETRIMDAMNEKLKIEEYISGIDDVQTRIIFNKRYIELKRWETIAKEMYMSERSVFRKHQNYLKENKNDRKIN